MPADGMDQRMSQRVTGNGFPEFPDFPQRSGSDYLAAVPSGSGAEVDDVVGSRHRLIVMFHHEEGIPLATECFQGVEELVVVAGVQANGGFVEDVEDAPQIGSELSGQTDALSLTA